MSSQQHRHAFGLLTAGLAIVGAFFLVRGMQEDSFSLTLGLLASATLIGVVGWRLIIAKTGKLNDAEANPIGEPKPALAPPDGHIRFTIVVESLEPARVAELWSDLCRPNRDVTEAFRLLYRNFTVLDGNRFRFMKGDPQATASLLADVLSAASGTSVRTSLEPAAERTPLWS
jgi:hypothetical protein